VGGTIARSLAVFELLGLVHGFGILDPLNRSTSPCPPINKNIYIIEPINK
jgi:hypothetical protein